MAPCGAWRKQRPGSLVLKSSVAVAGERRSKWLSVYAVSREEQYSRRLRLCSYKCTAHLWNTSDVIPVGSGAVAGLLILDEIPGACGLSWLPG